MSTSPHPRMLVGNWKMHGRQHDLEQIAAIAGGIGDTDVPVMICPPATLIARAVEQVRDSPLMIGAQDCHTDEDGAHTGDLAAEMLAEVGATAVIVGHSERRTNHGETDEMVHAKATAARRAELQAIICIGESEAQYDADETISVIGTQLAQSVPDDATPENTVIAYEPVWAIGTGKTPTVAEVGAAHSFIRGQLVERFGSRGAEFRILYGGSVNAGNAAELFAADNVAGGLVGGASLTAEKFLPILDALR